MDTCQETSKWSKMENISKLPCSVRKYVEEKAEICQPDAIYICDGSEEENQNLLKVLQESGSIQKLDKMKNCWLALTDPKDGIY